MTAQIKLNRFVRWPMAQLAAASALVLGAPAAGQTLDVLEDIEPGDVRVRLELVADGLGGVLEPINNDGPVGQNFAIDLTPLPDGRALIMTLGGTIYMLSTDGSINVFHDVVDPAVTEINPRFFGPSAIQAHPDFATNGIFYTIETEVEGTAPADFGDGNDHQDVLYEYDMDDPAAMSLSETSFTKRQVLRIDQPRRDHNLNDLVFLPDGTLLIASGDGSNSSGGGSSIPQLRAQDPGVVFGKVLRIDPDSSTAPGGTYGIPADNPFVGEPGTLAEIYSLGHRNPFRMSFDAPTGVWIGEVGQRNIEEVNRIEAGRNYGWAFKEGSFLFGDLAGDANGDGVVDDRDVAPDPDADGNGTGDFADANGLTDPIFEYDRGSGRSIAGGRVYRGSAIPELVGQYVFGDTFTSGDNLFYADASAGPAAGETGGIQSLRIADGGVPAPSGVVGFGVDGAGELLVLTTDGTILGLLPAPCRADLDGDGELTLFDFLAFQNLFDAGDPAADFDGDGDLTIFDFLAFQNEFAGGCP
ncbi:MAG: PQQ-dependent sugar dehydrogenase [Phycisphaerales bacterium]